MCIAFFLPITSFLSLMSDMQTCRRLICIEIDGMDPTRRSASTVRASGTADKADAWKIADTHAPNS